jgi:hypothetical protein
MIRLIFLLIFLLNIVSCASTDRYASSSTDDNSVTIHVYRTKVAFHSLNPEKPYIYLNDKVIAKLGTGQSETVRIPPGLYRLSVRQPVLFMPGRESDSFEHEFVAGETYYLRYHYGLRDASYVSGTPVFTGTSSLHLTSEKNFRNRN